MKGLIPFLFFLSVLYGSAQDGGYVTVNRNVTLMGSPFEITVVSVNEELGYISIDEAIAEIERIEKMISAWNPDSETALINKNAGIKPVKVSDELFALIERANQVSAITNGAFDLTFASINTIWKFDGTMERMPTASELKKSIAKVGYEKIILNAAKRTVYLKEKGMKIGFGAIGKGYAADRAKQLLVSKQVISGVINAGGDTTTWGTKASGEKWLVGVAHLKGRQRIFSWLPIVESSVATSENSDKYVIFNGKKYTHIIDPRNGMPATGIKRVSVFAKSAETCDALATAVFIMGKEAGIALIDQLGGPEVILIDDDDNMYKSDGILLDGSD
ncbi:FAD:protein FMN transferase [Maribacter sp. 2-571]|uniref:FAD:protein FMN transferase n=1 Tax=Maribacter sp. 2-571 TaxID=3417569 RepID=UPI003D347B24